MRRDTESQPGIYSSKAKDRQVTYDHRHAYGQPGLDHCCLSGPGSRPLRLSPQWGHHLLLLLFRHDSQREGGRAVAQLGRTMTDITCMKGGWKGIGQCCNGSLVVGAGMWAERIVQVGSWWDERGSGRSEKRGCAPQDCQDASSKAAPMVSLDHSVGWIVALSGTHETFSNTSHAVGLCSVVLRREYVALGVDLPLSTWPSVPKTAKTACCPSPTAFA